MRHISTSMLVALALAASVVSLTAHQLTFKGTVVSFEKTADPEMALSVSVVDPETKEVSPMTFYVDAETKILRGDRLVAMAEARITKGESVAVTVDHDLDEELAIVVRLSEAP